ncbi:hypothetical protein [Rheinheimera baltica]|uniref:hypothetical protein n=1 Tax=Rheinheimera baltica TaxID=67576 RepID=UPI00273F1346|nr:hypothetical protein [Rheinheimera baltica]MDP5142549.1 hypothetical protein [Rheinheimera baltica]MDP5188924.1 hypothetical protein [Rheinheimera baltica]
MNKLVFLLIGFVLTACQTVPPIYYEPPPAELLETAASIVGTRVKPDNIFHDDETTFVLAIDGLPVKASRGNFDKPVYISPGMHTVQIANKQGTLMANVAFNIEIESKEKYIAKTEVLDLENVRSWVENSKGEKVTPVLVGARISGGSAVIPIIM